MIIKERGALLVSDVDKYPNHHIQSGGGGCFPKNGHRNYQKYSLILFLSMNDKLNTTIIKGNKQMLSKKTPHHSECFVILSELIKHSSSSSRLRRVAQNAYPDFQWA